MLYIIEKVPQSSTCEKSFYVNISKCINAELQLKNGICDWVTNENSLPLNNCMAYKVLNSE